MNQFKFLDNPENQTVKIYGHTRQEIFDNAILAMMTFLYPKQIHNKDHETKEKISIKASNLKELLYEWLTIVNKHSEQRDVCYNEVQIDEITEHQIKATIYGRRVRRHRAIESIPKQKIDVIRKEKDFEATIVFNL